MEGSISTGTKSGSRLWQGAASSRGDDWWDYLWVWMNVPHDIDAGMELAGTERNGTICSDNLRGLEVDMYGPEMHEAWKRFEFES